MELIKNVKLKNKGNIIEEGFIEINKNVYRKSLLIGFDIGMYITIGVEDNFLNIAVINEKFLAPHNLIEANTTFNQNCIEKYNEEILRLVEEEIIELI